MGAIYLRIFGFEAPSQSNAPWPLSGLNWTRVIISTVLNILVSAVDAWRVLMWMTVEGANRASGWHGSMRANSDRCSAGDGQRSNQWVEVASMRWIVLVLFVLEAP